MSFHGLVDTSDRSTYGARAPSLPRSSTVRVADETTRRRPSGRKSMHIGKESCSTSTLRAAGADGEDLARSPVGEPQPVLVPPRRLPEHDAVHEHVHVR